MVHQKKTYPYTQLILSLLLFLFILYSPNLFNGFTWLDHSDIEAKQIIKSTINLHEIFLTPMGATSFYRPMVVIIGSINYFFFSLQPFGYHLTNVLLQLGVVILTPYFLAKFIPLSPKERIFTAFIVGIHPVISIVVGQISYRQESLMVGFLMLAIIFYTKARASQKKSDIFMTALLTSFALWSKETSLVLLPLLIIFWEICINRQKSLGTILWIVESVTLASYLLMRKLAIPWDWSIKAPELSFEAALGTRISLVIKWLNYLINPLGPNLSDSIPIHTLLDPTSICAGGVILLLLIVVKILGRRSRYGILIIMLLLFLLPGLDIIPVPRIGSPHYAYLPLIPFAGILSMLCLQIKSGLGNVVKGVIVLWVSIAITTTFTRSFQFANDHTLFKPEIKKDPSFKEGYNYLGAYYLSQKDFENAQIVFLKSLQQYPDRIFFQDLFSFTTYTMSVAEFRVQSGDYKGATAIYQKLLPLAPISLKPFIEYGLADIAYKQEDYQKVISLLMHREGIWYQASPYLLLGKAFHALGRTEEEKAILLKSLPYLTQQQRIEMKHYLSNFREN